MSYAKLVQYLPVQVFFYHIVHVIVEKKVHIIFWRNFN